MKIYLSIVLSWIVLSACSPASEPTSEPKVGGRATGSLRGLEALEDTINERLFLPRSETIGLRRYLGDESSGLVALLGAFTEVTGFSIQRRAVPNAVNTFLWQKVSAGAADDLAARACQASAGSLVETFYRAAHTLCLARDPKAPETRQAMESLWMSLARFEAPEAERDMWISDELGVDGIVATSEGQERVAELVQSILMNPYFMLEH